MVGGLTPYLTVTHFYSMQNLKQNTEPPPPQQQQQQQHLEQQQQQKNNNTNANANTNADTNADTKTNTIQTAGAGSKLRTFAKPSNSWISVQDCPSLLRDLGSRGEGGFVVGSKSESPMLKRSHYGFGSFASFFFFFFGGGAKSNHG